MACVQLDPSLRLAARLSITRCEPWTYSPSSLAALSCLPDLPRFAGLPRYDQHVSVVDPARSLPSVTRYRRVASRNHVSEQTG